MLNLNIGRNKNNTGEIKNFDLNIEKILENWETYHAIREIIANAIDEQILTNTKDISVYKDDNRCWNIVDYGRGLNYKHLTQNENQEKLNHKDLIGRFGVGLKDALATLYRHNIKVTILSKYGIITLKESCKANFNDITTLHAEIKPIENKNIIGTKFSLQGCEDSDIYKAKELFLLFSQKNILEKTIYGEIINSDNEIPCIYINGVKVAEEPDFLFSYNITSLTTQIKKSLNRERSNVGRSAYTNRIKDILKASSSEIVQSMLIQDLKKYADGDSHDELMWSDIMIYVAKKLNDTNEKIVFIDSTYMEENKLIDYMTSNFHEPIVLPKTIISKMNEENLMNDNDDIFFKTSKKYMDDIQSNYNPTITDIESLALEEKNIYSKTKEIFNLLNIDRNIIKEVLIVDKIYDQEFFVETLGIWNPENKTIMIKRNQLKSLSDFLGALLHECAHAISNADDITEEFEKELTNLLGKIASKLLEN